MASSFSHKFEMILQRYPKQDGGRWSSREIEEATGGFVTRSYVSNLLAGRIRRPGLDRLKAISRAMGFPVALWYEEVNEWNKISADEEARKGLSLAQRLNLLIETTLNEGTGERFKEEEIARLSFGHLSEDKVGEIRRGELTDLTMAQLMALSDIFGVDVSYWWVDAEHFPALTSELMSASKDAKSSAILNKVYGRSDTEKDMILAMLEQLDRLHKSEPGSDNGS